MREARTSSIPFVKASGLLPSGAAAEMETHADMSVVLWLAATFCFSFSAASSAAAALEPAAAGLFIARLELRARALRRDDAESEACRGRRGSRRLEAWGTTPTGVGDDASKRL